MSASLDIGAAFQAAVAIINTSVTAGGGADGVEADGRSIDRSNDFSDPGHSAACLVSFEATLAAGETATVSVQFQDSPDGSAWTDIGSAQAFTVGDAASTGAQNIFSVIKAALQEEGAVNTLRDADQFIRAQFTVTMSATMTDTFVYHAVWVVGGLQDKPGSGPSITA